MFKSSSLYHGRWLSWKWPLVIPQPAVCIIVWKEMGIVGSFTRKPWASKPGYRTREKICLVSVCVTWGVCWTLGLWDRKTQSSPSTAPSLLGSRAQETGPVEAGSEARVTLTVWTSQDDVLALGAWVWSWVVRNGTVPWEGPGILWHMANSIC